MKLTQHPSHCCKPPVTGWITGAQWQTRGGRRGQWWQDNQDKDKTMMTGTGIETPMKQGQGCGDDNNEDHMVMRTRWGGGDGTNNDDDQKTRMRDEDSRDGINKGMGWTRGQRHRWEWGERASGAGGWWQHAGPLTPLPCILSEEGVL